MSKTAFERYAPFIQEYIYRKKWADLREVQTEACDAILDADSHLIIASGTASGKTEAAFFPVLTLLHQNPAQSVAVIYIGPLKALINDQFERLSGLLEESGIPIWPWHGDVSQNIKNRALKEARGILQITPESLEALLMRRPGEAKRLFSDLRFIIIDEIHAMMGTDRGLHVVCLIARLERMTGCEPRRIGLSATLNDYRSALMFLSNGSARKAEAVGVSHHKRTVSLCVESFIKPQDEQKAITVMRDYNEFIYDNCNSKKCLIFTNSRSNAEKVIMDMKGIAEERGERDIFHVHHGSVSQALRHEAETALRENAGPTVAAATLTLELGIDIGDLDSTIQIGAPYSCASFVQRLGRSGRRAEKSQMMFVSMYEDSGKNSFDSLPWELLRAIAVIQLYLEERWVEPFILKPKPFSMLAHQTLSVLMAYGEISPADLARNVLQLPAFKDTVTQDEYRELLRHMIQCEYLERMESGGIIVGLKGERLANHYSFYSVFEIAQEYRVQSKDGEVGSLQNCPGIGEIFVLAGRSWMVKATDEDRKIIFVTPVKSSRIPIWSGTSGNIHAKVVQRMRQVLTEDVIYPYLRPNAAELLVKAREMARKTGLLDNYVLQTGANIFFLSPWSGTKELRTIEALLNCGLKKEFDILGVFGGRHYLQITSGIGVSSFIKKMESIEICADDPNMVLPEDRTPYIDKYDAMVPDNQLRKAFLLNELDVKRAVEILKRLKEPLL